MKIKPALLVASLAYLPVLALGSEWIADSHGCKTWNPNPVSGERVTWSGKCRNGYTEGYGKLEWLRDGKPTGSYEGTMRRGKADGVGVYEYGDGRIFDGEWKDGRRNGRGVLTSAKGERYFGEWKEDKRVGQGELMVNSGLLKDVVTYPNEGAKHVRDGEHVIYRTDPPTSGPHEAVPTNPGFYRAPQRPEKLVHSLEHGIVVIYYDRPEPIVLKALAALPARYPGLWNGVIVTPKRGLGAGIVLTAWTRMLRMQRFEPDTALAFISAFRGKGPERPPKR